MTNYTPHQLRKDNKLAKRRAFSAYIGNVGVDTTTVHSRAFLIICSQLSDTRAEFFHSPSQLQSHNMGLVPNFGIKQSMSMTIGKTLLRVDAKYANFPRARISVWRSLRNQFDYLFDLNLFPLFNAMIS